MAVTEYQCIFYQKTRRHIPEDIYYADIHLCHQEHSFFRHKAMRFYSHFPVFVRNVVSLCSEGHKSKRDEE